MNSSVGGVGGNDTDVALLIYQLLGCELANKIKINKTLISSASISTQFGSIALRGGLSRFKATTIL